MNMFIRRVDFPQCGRHHLHLPPTDPVAQEYEHTCPVTGRPVMTLAWGEWTVFESPPPGTITLSPVGDATCAPDSARL